MVIWIFWIGLINSHTLFQFNQSSYFNEMNWGVENEGISGGNCSITVLLYTKQRMTIP